MGNELCIILVGAPCSGKSTIGRTVANKINAKYISSGDIARQMASADTNISNDLSIGKLAPEDMMRDAIRNEIENTCNDIIIMDGFPRFGGQAEWLYEQFKMDIRYALIKTPLSVLIDRARNRGRMDDNSFVDRCTYYVEVTMNDLREHIEYEIDGSQPIDVCTTLLTQYIRSIEKYREESIEC